MKIKKLLEKISNSFKKTVKNYKITMITIFITTLIFTIFIDESSKILEHTELFFSLMCFASYFTETIYKTKMNKLVSLCINVVISLVLTIFTLTNKSLVLSANHLNDLFIMFSFGYVLLLFVLSSKYLFKKSKLSFNAYLTKIFNNIIYSIIIYTILVVAILLLTTIFNTLFFTDTFDYLSLYERTQILLFGFFFIPSMIHSFYVLNSDNQAFIKNLIKYVLFPVIVVALIIVYIYMFKILINMEIPSNMIFRILMGIFVFAFPIFIMLEEVNENKLVEKIIISFPYIFIPLILLETYAIYVRIIGYGLTPLRYICIILLILQISSLIIKIRKMSFNKLYNILITLIILTFVSPFNMQTVTKLNQLNILKNNFPDGKIFSELSLKEKEKASSAYKFLIEKSYNKKLIPNYISKEDITLLLENYDNEIERIYINFYSEEAIDIDGYNTLEEVHYSNKEETEIEIYNISFYNNKNDKVLNVNFIDFMNDLYSNYKNNEFLENNIYFDSVNDIYIDENSKLHINNISFDYNIENNEITYLDINAYLIKK